MINNAAILKEEKVIEKEEKKIEKEEAKIVQIERALRNAAGARASFLRKFAKHKFIFSMVTAIGVVLVWRGLWDLSEVVPGLESSAVALVIGIGLLWLVEKYTDVA